MEHRVILRDERRGRDWRHLWAYVDEQDRRHIDGQDLGPGTEIVSTDGEYEWFQTIAAADVPRVVEIRRRRPASVEEPVLVPGEEIRRRVKLRPVVVI